MQNIQETKRQLHEACVADVEKRIGTLRDILRGIDESRTSETKSSVGDKYETGRSMLHQEEAKSHRQLAQALQLRQELERIDPARPSSRVEPGSLVVTSRGVYYVAIGLGKWKLNQQLYYCISVQSPIGEKLLRKQAGEAIEFNGTVIRIEAVH